MTLLKQIEINYPHLSPAERRVADYLIKNEQVIVTHSSAELATLVQVSKATVSRTFRSLGYHNHQHLRTQLREARERGVPVPIGQLEQAAVLEEEWQLMVQAHQEFAAIESSLASLLTKARHIYIIGFRNGQPAAQHLRQQLAQLRSGIKLLPGMGQTLAEDLVDIDAHDVVILMGFRRRINGFRMLVNDLSSRLPKRCLIMFTDPSGNHYQEQVGTLIHCPLGLSQPMDNYSVVFSLIARLVNTLAHALHANPRIESIQALYEKLNELDG